ncbi:AbrB/MazE/SpoVT family DNA-binding domain-containing protein [Candidatus Falkowbacteria bacterium]|nr:AbrB/MazE/SpoVT family DNA-binding domain-containing protein [Candidatus Falkowbacteria bacterium]
METKTLKLFGTGQITIPKEWREFFGADILKAVFDKDKNEIKIKPVRMVEMEETKWVPLKQLEKDLDQVNLNKKFKKELLDGYKKSDFYLNKK